MTNERVQEYDDFGDSIIAGGGWWCEHDDGTATRMIDSPRPVSCPDCGTKYVCWIRDGLRLAKPVVMRVSE